MAYFSDEARFLAAVAEVFERVEDWLDASGADVDTALQGPVLQIDFADQSRVILNAQAPLQEIWLASRAGGWHFRADATGAWVDTRAGESLEALLVAAVYLHGGAEQTLAPLQLRVAASGSTPSAGTPP